MRWAMRSYWLSQKSTPAAVQSTDKREIITVETRPVCWLIEVPQQETTVAYLGQCHGAGGIDWGAVESPLRAKASRIIFRATSLSQPFFVDV